jgi:hypothetical protein
MSAEINARNAESSRKEIQNIKRWLRANYRVVATEYAGIGAQRANYMLRQLAIHRATYAAGGAPSRANIDDALRGLPSAVREATSPKGKR